MTLIMEVKENYHEYFKTLKKYIERDSGRWKGLLCSRAWRINTKIATLPKVIYRLNAIPIKILMTLLTEIEKAVLKFIYKHKRHWMAQAMLEVSPYLISRYTTEP